MLEKSCNSGCFLSKTKTCELFSNIMLQNLGQDLKI